MINLRPSFGNRSRGVADPATREAIAQLVARLVRRWLNATHRDLAAGGWRDLSLAEQLGNIGSEISRAERWKTRNPEISRAAFFRALELLDLTLADPRLRESRPRLREIARAREVVADYFAGPNQHASTGPSLQKYFDAFVVLSRQRQPAR